MCTGTIWTRWCFIIKPRNLFLASVNFLMACVGVTQVTRILQYQSEMKGQSLGDMAAEKAKEGQAKVAEAVREPEKIKEAVVGK
jgi:mitochondrial pyruvate carrier 2